jgi:hypothetical protein
MAAALEGVPGAAGRTGEHFDRPNLAVRTPRTPRLCVCVRGREGGRERERERERERQREGGREGRKVCCVCL